MATLEIHDIGRAGQADATVITEHADASAAHAALVARYGASSIRGRDGGGTIGSVNGTTFQASKVWAIR